MQALPLRIFGIMQNDTLLAIPFFTFMGLILERSGMAEDLLDTIGQLFGPIRGGLAFAVILVGAMLAATTGVVAASVISMGLISLPIMLRYGYDRRVASGVIAASGTLAQIIPPSLVLIIMADQLGKSVGDLYKGAFIPGFVLTGLYLGYVAIVAMWRPQWAPALPEEARTIREADGSAGLRSLGVLTLLSVAAAVAFAKITARGHRPRRDHRHLDVRGRRRGLRARRHQQGAHACACCRNMAERVTFVLIPPLALIFLVLGTIFLGIATPTEGGAMGATGALIMAMARAPHRPQADAPGHGHDHEALVLRALHPDRLHGLQPVVPGCRRPQVGGAPADRPARRPGGLPDRGQHPDLRAGVLPRLLRAVVHRRSRCSAPVADKLGIDLVWFGVLLAVNMQTSFMHPPFGFALFYLRSVAPHDDYTDKITNKPVAKVTTGQIYWGAVPFVVIQIIMVGLIIAFPGLVSSGLVKEETIDADKAFQELRMQDDACGSPRPWRIRPASLPTLAPRRPSRAIERRRPDEGAGRRDEGRREEVEVAVAETAVATTAT